MDPHLPIAQKMLTFLYLAHFLLFNITLYKIQEINI